jgi:retron-type reverse transcriptase
LLDCFQSYDHTADDYQFGFKNKHSTSLACSVLKRTVDYYRKNGSHVFVCMLDLSKAFDSVNHLSLFKKLVALDFPANLVELLATWYVNQQINVRWKKILTDSFLMRNGIRQGSILSPYLFSVYMCDVSDVIMKSGVGCYVGNKPCNILLHADDFVLISPSWYAQQRLLDLCFEAV